MKYAARILVCVIAVSKSQEFLLKVRPLFIFFFDNDAAAFTSTRHNFFDNDSRDLSSRTSQCFFDELVNYYMVAVVGQSTQSHWNCSMRIINDVSNLGAINYK